eukprot:jgi/Tetstr1/447008/TSEL_034466.t1
MVAQHQAMDEESRDRTVMNLIRTLSPKIGVQILQADVRVVTRRPPKPAAVDPTGPSGTRRPTTTGGLTEADMWLHLTEGLLPEYNRPHPNEAATDQPAATPTNALALLECMHHHHTEPTLLRVGDDNLCAISLGKEGEEFADTLRLAVVLTSHVALLRAIRLRTIIIFLTESEFDPPSELFIHPFSQTIREAGELGSNTGHNQSRRAGIGLREKARKTGPAPLALRAAGRPVYTLTLQLTAHHHSIIGGTRGTDRTEQWRKTVSIVCGKIKAEPTPEPTETRPADTSPAPPPAGPNQLPPPATPAAQTTPQADDEEELELNYEDNDSAMEVDTAQRAAAVTPGLADMSLNSPQRSTAHRTFREGTPNGTTERLAELHHLTTVTTKRLA